MPVVDDLWCHLCRSGKTCEFRNNGDGTEKTCPVARQNGECQIYKPIAEAPLGASFFIFQKFLSNPLTQCHKTTK